MDYHGFLKRKAQIYGDYGFNPVWVPGFLFDFQKHLVEWSLKKGRSAIFADCGLGKTPMQLVWAENVVRKTNGNVLIATPLSVSKQTIREGEKFGVEVFRSKDGQPKGRITVTNYEQLTKFNPSDYVGFVCDESSILKNFDGVTKKTVTEFIKKMSYRLLCTATAAPNDYIELGTASEALGYLGYMDMLNRFFKNTQGTCDTKTNWGGGGKVKWRFKGHAEKQFWRWVCSWARAIRKPSDLGFDNNGFVLPPLIERETILKCSRPLPGYLFPQPAQGLKEQREERRATIKERCECAAEKVDHGKPAVVWCHLNDEADLLEKLIHGSVQVSGSMSDDAKENAYYGFSDGNIRVIIIKPKIGAFGLNWQHCNHTVFFPSHSYEQYYQGVRRFWRFGQKEPVTVDVITTEGEVEVLKNLQKKSQAADKMFDELLRFMNDSINIKLDDNFNQQERIPEWL